MNNEETTEILIEEEWDTCLFDDEEDEYLRVNKIWCKECEHEFDILDYDKDMIEEMKYCPFCGRKIEEVRDV